MRSTLHYIYGALFLIFSSVGLLALWSEYTYKEILIAGDFSPLTFSSSSYFLYDLGVTDQNRDENLDIFFANHYAKQSILVNQGNNSFVDRADELGLSHTVVNFGFEDMAQGPKLGKEGLFIYWKDSKLFIQSNVFQSGQNYSGTLTLRSPVEVKKGEEFLTVSSSSDSKLEAITNISFSLSNHDLIELDIYFVTVPMEITFHDSTPLKEIYLGGKAGSPPSHKVTFLMKDRHGQLWVPGGEDYMDVYIVRGGLRGELERQGDTSVFADELLKFESGKNQYFSAMPVGVEKSNCSGHQVSAVDFNIDDKLDIYIACRRQHQPNQLYQRSKESYKKESESTLNIDAKWLGPHAWVPGGKYGPNLISAHSNKIWIYENKGAGGFKKHLLSDENNKINNFAIADINDDGLFDIFASSLAGSTLLIAQGQTVYETVVPEDIGLPRISAHAEWVDIDNDGTKELHSLPGGMFHKDSNSRKYQQVENITTRFDNSILEARGSWFDLNNDGLLDFVGSVHFKASYVETAIQKITGYSSYSKNWNTFLAINNNQPKNWLQLSIEDGIGGAGSVGARITVESESGKQWSQFAWQSESSHSSQGHYRLYFGFGKDQGPYRIEINWPNGHAKTVKNVMPNQLVLISEVIFGQGIGFSDAE
ncbi:MAG: hypothetical protein ACI9CO_000223 [Candidatus Azotimanducaceae bacterium]|jgi:hypothetical protein